MKQHICQLDRPRGDRGFTLVEVMVAASVGMLVIALSMSSFLALSRAAAGSVNAAAVHSKLRLGMDRMTKDLIGASAITGCDPAGFILFNVVTPAGAETRNIHYDRTGQEVYSVRSGNRKVLIENVDDMAFTLYDADGLVTTVPANAVSVGVTISGTRLWAGTTYSDEVYTQVMLRNKTGG